MELYLLLVLGGAVLIVCYYPCFLGNLSWHRYFWPLFGGFKGLESLEYATLGIQNERGAIHDKSDPEVQVVWINPSKNVAHPESKGT